MKEIGVDERGRTYDIGLHTLYYHYRRQVVRIPEPRDGRVVVFLDGSGSEGQPPRAGMAAVQVKVVGQELEVIVDKVVYKAASHGEVQTVADVVRKLGEEVTEVWMVVDAEAEMAFLRRLAAKPLHGALGTGLASQLYMIWHGLEMRSLPLVRHLVKQELHRAAVGNHAADGAAHAVDKKQEPESRVPERREHLHMMHIPPRVGEEERDRWVVEEDRGRRELRVYPQLVHMLAQVSGGPEVVALSTYLEGRVRQQVHFPNVLRPETLPKRLQTRRLQAITVQVPARETSMRCYRRRGMELPEEYMRCHCGKELEGYEHFRQCEQYRDIDGPLVRDQEIPLLKKGARERREMERVLGKEGHRKRMWHMVIVKSLWWKLGEHTVALEVMAHRLFRPTVKHLQERMACRGTQLEARAGDMRDLVTKRVEMQLIRYNPQVSTMEVRPQPDWRLRQSEDAGDAAGQAGDEQRKCLMARRRKRVRQV